MAEANVVELLREESDEELGLRIVGGKDTPLGNIVIQEIVRDSIAARDGRLAPGDHILEVRKHAEIMGAAEIINNVPFIKCDEGDSCQHGGTRTSMFSRKHVVAGLSWWRKHDGPQQREWTFRINGFLLCDRVNVAWFKHIYAKVCLVFSLFSL